MLDVEQIASGARQPIRARHHERVTGVKPLEQLGELSTGGLRAGYLLSAPIGPLLRPPVYGPFSSEASNKALALLKRWLSPEQCKELEKRGSFDVVGCHTGRCYRIHPGKLNNVRILQDNVEVAALCFAPTDAGFLPEADIMLAQKIALETNEKAALKVAHQSPRYPCSLVL